MNAALSTEAGDTAPAMTPMSVRFAQRGSKLCLYVEWSDGSTPSLHMTRSIGDADMCAPRAASAERLLREPRATNRARMLPRFARPLTVARAPRSAHRTRVVSAEPSINRISVESGRSVRLILATDVRPHAAEISSFSVGSETRASSRRAPPQTQGVWDHLPLGRVSAILKTKAPLATGGEDAALAVARAVTDEARRSAEEGSQMYGAMSASQKIDDMTCIIVDLDVIPSVVEARPAVDRSSGGPSTTHSACQVT